MARQQHAVAPVANRRVIAAAGVLIQVALGAVYAWSVFVKPLMTGFGWSRTAVTETFEIAIFTLGIAAFLGALWMGRGGPRVVAVTAGVLYGLGVFLASFSAHKLWWLYLTYGVLAGLGLGLGYIVPVATLVKWFPDKRGMMTGIAVAGFGAGALITAPAATSLIKSGGVLHTFAILGIIYLVVVVIGGLFMQNPPDGYAPAGWTPSAGTASRRSSVDYTLGESLKTWQWYGLWAMLFLNVIAGISIISQAAPMAQEIAGVNAKTAAYLVSIISIANACGRFLWAWFSDLIGRRMVFLIMFVLQAILSSIPSGGSPSLRLSSCCATVAASEPCRPLQPTTLARAASDVSTA